MTRENIISVFFAALLLFVVYSTLVILSPFVRPIFWSAIIAFGFYPLYLRILGLCKNRRELAAFFTTLLIFLLVAPVITFLLTSLIREVSSAYEWFLGWTQAAGVEEFMAKVHSIPFIERLENSEFFQAEGVREHIKKLLLNFAEISGKFAVRQAALITKNFFVAVIYFFMMIFLVFFFLKDGAAIYEFIYKITPLDEKTKRVVFTQLGDTFSAVLRGQIVTALVQGTLAGVIYWILGLPLPLFFAGVTFLAALIPVFGAATVWVPFTVYLVIIKEYPSALILFLLGFFVISLVDNFLKPFLIGEKAKLPYLLLFLGILGGLQVYGLMGIFLAPAILSLFFVLIKIYQEEILAEKLKHANE